MGWVTGTVGYSVQSEGVWRSYKAEYRQIWLENDDHWQLWTMTVGQFELQPAAAGQEAIVAGE